MSSYYDDEDDLDIHVSRRRASPPVHYVEARPRPRNYYAAPPNYLAPERTVITTRSRSRERSRERRSSPPVVAPAPAPVIINNRIYNEHSSDEEDGRYMQVAAPRRRSHSRSRSSSLYHAREEYEMERTRKELEDLRLAQAREREERRAQKEYREEAELQRAKKELDEIRRREAREADEKRIKREMELERLREEEREAEQKKKRDKEAEAAVERYKQKELERLAKEKQEKEENEKEYKRRLQEDLINSGLDEKAIAAIMKKEKIREQPTADGARPTYTRMARRHLSIETLRTFKVEYELDSDADFVLIKRWVPEWEQDAFWKHTRYIREKRSSKLLLTVDDKKHHHHHNSEPEFEWVRKKSERKRSKSPALLMYLAGARPA